MPIKTLFNPINGARPHLERVIPNLRLIKYCTTQKNLDSWAMVVGYEGGGKSNCGCALAEAYLGVPPYTHIKDPDTPLTLNKDNWVFTPEDFITRPYDLPRGSPLIADEGATTMLADETITKEGKEVKKLTTVLRERNLFVIICVPEWDLVQPYIRARRTQSVYRCVNRGTVLVYNKPQIQRIRRDEKSKQLIYPPPAFKDHWQQRKGELWEEYDAMKNDYLANRNLPAILKTMRAGQVAKLFGKSYCTVRNWAKRGDLKYNTDVCGQMQFTLEDCQEFARKRGVKLDV